MDVQYTKAMEMHPDFHPFCIWLRGGCGMNVRIEFSRMQYEQMPPRLHPLQPRSGGPRDIIFHFSWWSSSLNALAFPYRSPSYSGQLYNHL
jgi:hypothetical protein